MIDREEIILKIERFLEATDLPSEIILDKATVISNPKLFFESHLLTIKSLNSSDRFKKPYYDRIIKAIKIIKNNEKQRVEKVDSSPPNDSNEVMKRNLRDEVSQNNEIDFSVLENKVEKNTLRPNLGF